MRPFHILFATLLLIASATPAQAAAEGAPDLLSPSYGLMVWTLFT